MRTPTTGSRAPFHEEVGGRDTVARLWNHLERVVRPMVDTRGAPTDHR